MRTTLSSRSRIITLVVLCLLGLGSFTYSFAIMSLTHIVYYTDSTHSVIAGEYWKCCDGTHLTCGHATDYYVQNQCNCLDDGCPEMYGCPSPTCN